MNSVYEAKREAQTCANITGVRGIFAMTPSYFKPSSPENLVDTMAVVASGAPDLPFWYYHFPALTQVPINMYEFVLAADSSGKIPNLMGVKFTFEALADFNAIGRFKNQKYNMLMGRDEMLLSALATGVAGGGVGSTFNYMSFNLPLFDLWNNDLD